MWRNKLIGRETRARIRTITSMIAITLYLPDFLMYALTPFIPTKAATRVRPPKIRL